MTWTGRQVLDARELGRRNFAAQWSLDCARWEIFRADGQAGRWRG